MNCGTKRLVVRSKLKNAGLEHESEMTDGEVGCEKLPVESRIPFFGGREFLAKESERGTETVLELLQNAADVSGGGIDR